MKRGREVDREDRVPLIDRKVLDARDMLNARVVDQNIDPAKGFFGLAHHRFDLRRLAHVCTVVQRAHTECLQFLLNRRDRARVAEAIQHDVGAVARERARDTQPYPARGTRDQSSFSLQHLCLRKLSAEYASGQPLESFRPSRCFSPSGNHQETVMANDAPRQATVQCLSRSGIHRMAYVEWGEPDNPNVLVCVHGLTRVGRDFDRLAQALADRYRVVCPDVVGRGRSDWLREPSDYALPQYVADMVTLIARLGVDSVHWLGTSMGGLIGLALAGQPGSPIKRLVLNYVGPKINPEAVERIGAYVGKPVRFATLEEAVDYITLISLGFGLRTRDEWREITRSVVKPDGDGFTLHYDLKLGLPIKA